MITNLIISSYFTIWHKWNYFPEIKDDFSTLKWLKGVNISDNLATPISTFFPLGLKAESWQWKKKLFQFIDLASRLEETCQFMIVNHSLFA